MFQIWYNIMFVRIKINFWFTRSRLRRGPKFQSKLKDYSSMHPIKTQIKEYRRQFQTQQIDETISQAINTKKPVLKKRFKIDIKKLNKHLKNVMNQQVNLETIQPASGNQDDFKFLNQSRSHLLDQSLEVDFQEKFKKELFMKKETKRMLEKESRNFNNFLPQNRGNNYNKYLDAKNKLKNNRIDSMMNYKRNNQELQLLIQSGLMDQPENIKLLIDKINGEGGLEPFNEEDYDIEGKSKETGLVASEDDDEYTHPLEKQLVKNIEGPEQTRDFSKIIEFVDRYEESSEEVKKKKSQDVNLLLQVREYQRNLFLSRYDQINYRFKGKVNFNYFKQSQFLSYLKTQNILPSQLLLIYEQNIDRLSKFNIPIITPAVMSRIYTRTSIYRYGDSDENNHINMLNDPIFKKLEGNLFREVEKISDQLFCDTAWAYAYNHQLQRGLLNVKKSDAIQKIIFAETCERVHRLREEDLGLLMRSLIKLNLLAKDEYKNKWGEVVEAIQTRLPLMKMDYEWESVMHFLTLLDLTPQITTLIGKNINFFKKYNWESKASLITFSRIGSTIMNNHKMLDPFEHNKTLIVLKQIVAQKVEEIKILIPKLTINEISKSVVVFQQLSKIPFGVQLPAIIMNIAKKQIVDSIRMQKHQIYQHTIPTLMTTLAAYDYNQNVLRTQKKYISKEVIVTPFKNINILKYVPLRHMLPGRVFTYNSQLYFIYHEMAKLIQVEEQMMSTKSVADSLFGLGLVQYKHEGIVDTLTHRILSRIEENQKQTKQSKLSSHDVVNLMKIASSYSLQKRNTDVVGQICDQIFENGKSAMKEIQLNILIRFFGAYVNINTQPTELPEKQGEESIILRQRWNRNKNFNFSFLYCFKNYMKPFLSKLQIQQLIPVYFVQTMVLNNLSRISSINSQLKVQYEGIIQQAKKNVEELLKKISNIPEDKLKPEYKFIIAGCIELNHFDIDVKEKYQSLAQFEKFEKMFYDRNIEQILKFQEHIGVSESYLKTVKKLTNELKKQVENKEEITKKLWRIEDEPQKTVYFFATFEHLMTKYSNDETAFALFGLWKLYSQIYFRKGWNFELICTMLQN